MTKGYIIGLVLSVFHLSSVSGRTKIGQSMIG